MLFGFVRQGLGHFRDALPRRRGRIVLVCATRLGPDAFWANTPVGPAFRQLMVSSRRVECRISFNNQQGLSAVYNAALEAAQKNDILVFVHDDVWFPAKTLATLEKSLQRGLSRFDIIGVVGNRRRVAYQPTWIIPEDVNGEAVMNMDFLSGAIEQGTPEHPRLQDYGPAPAACELLDGVLLAARAGRLAKAGVGFDERFYFHHYDLDFCRTARQAGLRLGTWPMPVIHRSSGNFTSTAFAESLVRYLAKWEPAGTKPYVVFAD